MDKATLDAIRARADAATPGPWRFGGRTPNVIGLVYISGSSHYNICANTAEGVEFNASFIAEARTDIPALLDEIVTINNELGHLATLLAHAHELKVKDQAEIDRLTIIEDRAIKMENDPLDGGADTVKYILNG